MANQLNASDNGCIMINDAGVAFKELSCVHPNFCKLMGYSEFERTYDPVLVRDWMREHPIIPIIAVAVYGTFIVCGQRYFKDRNPLDWRKPLVRLSQCVGRSAHFCPVERRSHFCSHVCVCHSY